MVTKYKDKTNTEKFNFWIGCLNILVSFIILFVRAENLNVFGGVLCIMGLIVGGWLIHE